MAINRSSFSAQSISENTDIAINMLPSPPSEDVLDTLVTPNILHGFYNDATGMVQLYVTNAAGNRYIRVR